MIFNGKFINKLFSGLFARQNRLIPNPQKEAPFGALKKQGSYTVEAAFVLPIFLFFSIVILFFFQVLTAQFSVTAAMNQTAREWAYFAPVAEKEGLSQTAEKVAIIAAVDARLKEKKSPIDLFLGGYAGLDFSDSDLSENDIRLVAHYHMVLPLRFFGIRDWNLTATSVSRKWVGYDPTEETTSEYVYVTPYGRVYHTSLSCRYLDLSISSVPEETLASIRNRDGSRYDSCQVCGEEESAYYYVTDYGEVYHTRLNCPSLKRTIRRVKRSEVSGYGPCGKCALRKED